VLQRAIDKKDVGKLIAAMRKHGRVRGPVAGDDGAVLAELSAKSGPCLDYGNFKLPPKREFFPQCETIAVYDANGTVASPIDDENTVLFGIRPCDARSFRHLDRVFSDSQYTDPYFRKRRDNTLVISLACIEPAETCFCSSTGGGPADGTGSDAVVHDTGPSLLFEAFSPKGEAFLKKHSPLFREPTTKELVKRSRQETHARDHLRHIGVSDVPAALKKEIGSAVWDGIAETCLGCGACTYLCPTCHCFDLIDEPLRNGGRKLRVHDACMFASFTREASGHNPRAKKGERMRQRVMHKFSYAPDNFKEIFCVGCGRCIAHCPSNIDIRETIARVAL
jgi:ferredoxin